MRSLLSCTIVLIGLGSALAATGAEPSLIPPGAKVEKVAGGCKFTEGPAADADGNLFFTDSPRNRILVLRPGGKLDVFTADSRDANGMRFDARGRLVACCGEDGARAVVRWEKDGKRTILADRYQDKRLTAPNDLCFDRQGRVYFTDPCYGRKPTDGQERYAVYRIDAAGGEPVPNKVTRLIDDVDTPNGIAISPDNKTLYVADNAGRKNGPHTLVAYDIMADGRCRRRAVLHDFGAGRGIDGMVLDTRGNIYATAGSGPETGVYIFAPTGKQLGFLRTPETATNCTFGARDLKTLYITAGGSVYKVRLNAVGFLAYPAVSASPAPGAVSLASFADVKNIKAALVSPDGKEIACLVAITDLQANRIRSEVWLYPANEGKPRQLTLPTDSVATILWSPRGRQLAVVGRQLPASAKQKGQTYLWIVGTVNGEAKQLVRIERSNHYVAHQGADLCWSPDGKSLAYLATDAEKRPKDDGPIVINRIQYKMRTGLSDNHSTHIWIVDAATGKTRQLTKGRFDEHSIDWSPKGDEIVFCSNRGPDPDANLNYDLFTVKVSDGAIQQLTKTAGSEMTPVWSPDGKSIAYTMTKRPVTTIDSVAEDDHVWVLDRASGKAEELYRNGRCSHVRWAPDGNICFLIRISGISQMLGTSPSGVMFIPNGTFMSSISSFSLPRKKGEPVVVYSRPTEPPEVEWHSSRREHVIAGTEFNQKIVDTWKLVKPREVNFKSFDGTPVQGWLMVPPGATAKKKVPMILNIHGGPHGMHGVQFSAPFQLMCARGYAILYLNPRGSSGYGQRFSDGCVNDWGGGDYKDLMAGVDHVLAKYPELDGDRLGVMGGSYGGYMTDWVITQTSRFKAAVSYAGLSNLISFYGTSLYQDLMHVEFNGPPWEHYGLLWERSPLRHVKRVNTPTLFLHGEADHDVPITQSEEMYTALKQRGIETVFVRYPREGHGATEPRFQLDQLERTVAWFDRFLQKK